MENADAVSVYVCIFLCPRRPPLPTPSPPFLLSLSVFLTCLSSSLLALALLAHGSVCLTQRDSNECTDRGTCQGWFAIVRWGVPVSLPWGAIVCIWPRKVTKKEVGGADKNSGDRGVVIYRDGDQRQRQKLKINHSRPLLKRTGDKCIANYIYRVQ